MTTSFPGSLFQRLREAEKRDPGNEVVWMIPARSVFRNETGISYRRSSLFVLSNQLNKNVDPWGDLYSYLLVQQYYHLFENFCLLLILGSFKPSTTSTHKATAGAILWLFKTEGMAQFGEGRKWKKPTKSCLLPRLIHMWNISYTSWNHVWMIAVRSQKSVLSFARKYENRKEFHLNVLMRSSRSLSPI